MSDGAGQASRRQLSNGGSHPSSRQMGHGGGTLGRSYGRIGHGSGEFGRGGRSGDFRRGPISRERDHGSISRNHGGPRYRTDGRGHSDRRDVHGRGHRGSTHPLGHGVFGYGHYGPHYGSTFGAGFVIRSAPPSGYRYYDGYCDMIFRNLDIYLDHLYEYDHPSIVQIVDVRSGYTVGTCRYEGGTWVMFDDRDVQYDESY